MRSLECPGSGAAELNTPYFYIAAIHDSAVNARHSLRLCQRLIDAFPGDFLFHIALCDFDSFHSRTPAMRYAAHARLVLIAANEELPDEVWRWVENWAAQNADRPLAVAALRGDNDQLKQFCRSHDIDWIDPNLQFESSDLRSTPGSTQ